MSSETRWPYADAHLRASNEFRRLNLDQQRERMREAGVLGITPYVGDKVRVLGRLNLWHYGIVVGASPDGRIHVVHNDKDRGLVVQESLETFAQGQRVELIQRASSGREYEVAARALSLLGNQYDLLTFNCEHLAIYAQPRQSWSIHGAVAVPPGTVLTNC